MQGLGAFAVVIYLVLVFFLITLLMRFVTAVEKIAASIKTIADKFER